MTTADGSRRLTGWRRSAVDYGPLALLLAGFFFGAPLVRMAGRVAGASWCLGQGAELYVAISLFTPAFAIGLGYSWWKEGRVAPMMWLSAVIIIVMAGLTFALHNKTFFYMKPTLIYLLFAALLAGGLATGRNFLKIAFDGALTMPDEAWRILTWRYAAFFAVLAIANEVAWRYLTRDCAVVADAAIQFLRDCAGPAPARCAGETAWVNLKVFGFTAVNFVFVLAHAPFFAKHIVGDNAADARAKIGD